MFYDGFDVFFVAVSANHDNARAELGVNAFVGNDVYGAVDYGNNYGFADVLAVPLVSWVDFDGDACGNKLRAGEWRSQA